MDFWKFSYMFSCFCCYVIKSEESQKAFLSVIWNPLLIKNIFSHIRLWCRGSKRISVFRKQYVDKRGSEKEIQPRIRKWKISFSQFAPIWRSKQISIRTGLKLFNGNVVSTGEKLEKKQLHYIKKLQEPRLQSVKGRSSTINSRTKAEVLPGIE